MPTNPVTSIARVHRLPFIGHVSCARHSSLIANPYRQTTVLYRSQPPALCTISRQNTGSRLLPSPRTPPPHTPSPRCTLGGRLISMRARCLQPDIRWRRVTRLVPGLINRSVPGIGICCLSFATQAEHWVLFYSIIYIVRHFNTFNTGRARVYNTIPA